MGAHNYGEKKQTFQSAGTSHLEVRDCLLNNIREEVVHFFVRHAVRNDGGHLGFDSVFQIFNRNAGSGARIQPILARP